MQSPNESLSDTYFTPEVKRYIFSQDWPKGYNLTLRLDVFHGIPRLVLYRDEMIRMDGTDLREISNITNRIFAKLRADGLPIVLAIKNTKDESDV